ncbi:MAG: zinc ABC transporter substrate-binding protein [Anaerolineaceae bacterium]|nr:zinc ABC transporter substrate-binding protein [Anaerolineaceae bacterium]
MRHFRLISILILISSLLLGACQTLASPDSEKPSVFVSIPPQKYFVERIAGKTVNVSIMVEPGAEPHTYEPKPAQMAALANADLYFSIGDSFEDTWLVRIIDTNPDLQIIDTAAGIEKRPLDIHMHEEEGEDHQEGLDPHIWLSPRLVKIQARTIYDALVELNPEEKVDYDINFVAFLRDINILETNLTTGFADVSQHRFMVYHPSWGYFADEYGLEQIAIEIGGTEPSPSELASIIEQAKSNDIHVIFAQPEFNSRFADTIAEQIDGEVLLISPLEENWMKNMDNLGNVLISGLSKE